MTTYQCLNTVFVSQALTPDVASPNQKQLFQQLLQRCNGLEAWCPLLNFQCDLQFAFLVLS